MEDGNCEDFLKVQGQSAEFSINKSSYAIGDSRDVIVCVSLDVVT